MRLVRGLNNCIQKLGSRYAASLHFFELVILGSQLSELLQKEQKNVP